MRTVPLAWKLLLAALAALAPLLAIELGMRLATGTPLLAHGNERSRYSLPDPVVGHRPRAGIVLRMEDGASITTLEHGTRSNGTQAAPAARPLAVATGDSFAFGDGVSDHESWPAVFEQLSGYRVINGGVPGYGVDQAVLRAEQLAAVYEPQLIVLGFIPHDVLRCEMSYWSGHPKPYFEIDGSALRLHPPPVPPQDAAARLRRLLSASFALSRLAPTAVGWEGPRELVVHRQGREVACRLMERLAALGRTRRAQLIVLAHPQQPTSPPEHHEIKDALLACARAQGLLALDLFPAIEALPEAQRVELFPRHLTAEGYRLVGSELARFVAENARR